MRKLLERLIFGSIHLIEGLQGPQKQKTQWQRKTLSVIKTTGEKIELVTFSEYVYSIVIDKNDTLWLNTTSGHNRIYKIQLDNGTIISNELHFDYSEVISQDFRIVSLLTNLIP